MPVCGIKNNIHLINKFVKWSLCAKIKDFQGCAIILLCMPKGYHLHLCGSFVFFYFFLQAYHSQIKEFPQQVGNLAILPLRTQFRGPAPSVNSDNDIIDESLYFFKANVFFRTYEIKVNSCLLLLYIVVVILLTFNFLSVRGWSRFDLYYFIHYRMSKKVAALF